LGYSASVTNLHTVLLIFWFYTEKMCTVSYETLYQQARCKVNKFRNISTDKYFEWSTQLACGIDKCRNTGHWQQ